MANVTKAELAKLLEECKELSNQRENEVITLKCVIDKVESEKVALELKLNDLSDVDKLRQQFQRVGSELVTAKTELTSKEVELRELTASYDKLQIELKNEKEGFFKDRLEYQRQIDSLKYELQMRVSLISDNDIQRNNLSVTINELNQELKEVTTNLKVVSVLAALVTLTFITYIVVF